MEKDKKKKSSTGPGALIFVLMVILSVISSISETAETIVGIVIFAAVIIIAIVLITKGKMKKAGTAVKATPIAAALARASTPKEHPVYKQDIHSHDQLNQTKVVCCKDGYEHWVNQLNGFLAAGIIDKAEYRILLNKHSRDSFEEYNLDY